MVYNLKSEACRFGSQTFTQSRAIDHPERRRISPYIFSCLLMPELFFTLFPFSFSLLGQISEDVGIGQMATPSHGLRLKQLVVIQFELRSVPSEESMCIFCKTGQQYTFLESHHLVVIIDHGFSTTDYQSKQILLMILYLNCNNC